MNHCFGTGRGFWAHIRAQGGRFFPFLSLIFPFFFRLSPYTDIFMKAYTSAMPTHLKYALDT